MSRAAINDHAATDSGEISHPLLRLPAFQLSRFEYDSASIVMWLFRRTDVFTPMGWKPMGSDIADLLTLAHSETNILIAFA